MPCILYIETATEVCSVAVAQDDKVIYNRIDTKGPSHAVLLGTFVNDAVIEMRLRRIQIDAVAVSCGPGSYTGLRIGVSEAKGLCYGLNIPLIAIETLKIMASGVVAKGLVGNDSLLCPMIDARRMEVYDAIFGHRLDVVRPIEADIIDEASFSDILSKQKITFFGNGAAKCSEVLQSANAIFLENVYPQAKDMVPLALEAYKNNNFVDVAYFEPFYLKEFVATIAKNKVLPPH
ncbi:MAG: tRNA (adenosine(37)-N6)-threonylcarbamoyltransferase complex dimerization subunit type 1 TsaB [Dysgonomonas sp.]